MCLPLTSKSSLPRQKGVKTLGTLCVRFDRKVKSSLIQLRVQGEKMASRRFCSDNNNALEVYKPKSLAHLRKAVGDKTENFDLAGALLPEDQWVLVHRSEAINYNPLVIWKSFDIDSSCLISGLKDLPLKLVVKDYALRSGRHKVVGWALRTFNELISAWQNKETEAIPLHDERGRAAGFLRIMELSQSRSL